MSEVTITIVLSKESLATLEGLAEEDGLGIDEELYWLIRDEEARRSQTEVSVLEED